MQTAKDYLHVFLDMGDALLNSGAEIFRETKRVHRLAGYGKMAEMILPSWSS